MTLVRTRFLASVASLAEANIAARHGADIIDLKNPAAGALGALDTGVVGSIVSELGDQQLVSATIGDLSLENPAHIQRAIEQTAAQGVDIVKMGWFASHLPDEMLALLQQVTAAGVRLVVVLFAERGAQVEYLPRLAAAGVHGVMLDTSDKASGGLRDKLDDQTLHAFVGHARHLGLMCGLAGSLRQSDIVPLLELTPDYLGFRGALCSASNRTAGLDAAAVESVRCLINAAANRREANINDHGLSKVTL